VSFAGRVWRYLIVVLPAVVSASCSPPGDEADIGRAVAAALDTTMGSPIAIVDEYWCRVGEEPCRDRPGHVAASRVDATPTVSAFAEARGIPVVRYDGGSAPQCPWADSAEEEGGLWAEFKQPPQITRDSALVLVSTICGDGQRAFQQVHEYVLQRGNGGWTVVGRSLITITRAMLGERSGSA